MAQNVYRRDFWRHQNFDFRKVTIKKVNFVLQIDTKGQKLALVDPGEVCEYLNFPYNLSMSSTVFSNKNANFTNFDRRHRNEFLRFDIDPKYKTHLFDRNFFENENFVATRNIYSQNYSTNEVS